MSSLCIIQRRRSAVQKYAARWKRISRRFLLCWSSSNPRYFEQVLCCSTCFEHQLNIGGFVYLSDIFVYNAIFDNYIREPLDFKPAAGFMLTHEVGGPPSARQLVAH